jgi:hypothetical protein
MMKKYRMLACASTLVVVLGAVGCAGVSDDAEESELATSGAEAEAPAAPAAEQAAAKPSAPAAQAPAPKPRLSPPVRGLAQLGYTKPVVKPAKIGGKEFVVTTIQVKNMADGAIAGLRVEEFWYNKAGDAITGDEYRHPKPLQPGEIVTVTLETPRSPGMDRNQYSFKHANGEIRASLQPKL